MDVENTADVARRGIVRRRNIRKFINDVILRRHKLPCPFPKVGLVVFHPEDFRESVVAVHVIARDGKDLVKWDVVLYPLGFLPRSAVHPDHAGTDRLPRLVHRNARSAIKAADRYGGNILGIESRSSEHIFQYDGNGLEPYIGPLFRPGWPGCENPVFMKSFSQGPAPLIQHQSLGPTRPNIHANQHCESSLVFRHLRVSH